MKRNNYCGLCTECIKSCPKDNVGIFIRPFGSDRKLKGYDEMFNVIIMLVVAIVFSITMSGPWGVIKDAANVTESRQIVPFLIYVALIWILALGVFPGIRTVILRLAYILIPIGIFAWIAFSLPMLMVNYSYILNVLSDPLGLGWDILGTAAFPFQPLYPESIPIIQGILLLCGLYFGLSRGYLSLKEILAVSNARAKAMIIPSIFALLVINIFLRLYMG
jgi:hypothetical protein